MTDDDQRDGWPGIRPPSRLSKPLRQQARRFRTDQTPAEQILWSHLRKRQLKGYKFRRQHVIGRFVVDFYCAEASLVVELDGGIHHTTRERDAARQAYLKSLGLRVVRVANRDVETGVESIVGCIEMMLPDR